MSDVYIAGVCLTPFGKDFRPIGVMLADACQKALQDSLAFTSDIVPNCLVIGCMDPIRFARQTRLDSLVGMELGLARDTEIYHVELGSATGAGAVELGKRLASSGLKVLVCFGEKMKGKLKNEEIPSQISTVIAEEERERGLGGMPAVAALASYEYMDAYEVSEKEFKNICFEISVRSLKFGALNEVAYFKKPITREEYENPEINRVVAKPLTKFDCSGSYNGAGAVYLVPSPTDVKLASIKSSFDNIKIAERKTLISLEAAFNSPLMAKIVLFAGLCGIVTTWNTVFISGSRIIFALGRARIIPPTFCKIHLVFGSPFISVVFVGIVGTFGVFLGRSAILPIVNVAGSCYAFAFLFTCLGVLRLRRIRPGQHRPYRVPWGNIIPVVGFLSSCFALFLSLYLPYMSSKESFPIEWAFIIDWTVLGVLFWILARKIRVQVSEPERRKLILGTNASLDKTVGSEK